MPKVRLEEFAGGVIAASEAWPTKRGATNRPEAFERYGNASERLSDDVTASKGLTGRELVPDIARFGLRMMFRTCYIASMVAEKDGLSVDELTDVMMNPGSFETLRNIQHLHPTVAERVEEKVGLIPSDRAISRTKLPDWQIGDGVLVHTELDKHIEVAKQHTLSSRKTGECPFHRKNLNAPVFAAVVAICAHDQNLFKRSLS